MAKKAILITEANRSSLYSNHSLEEDVLDDKLGTYLITDFGQDKPILGYLSKLMFSVKYRVTRNLKNDYLEIKERNVEV